MKKTIFTLLALIFINISISAQYSYHKLDVTGDILAPVLGYGVLIVDYSLTESHSIGIEVNKKFTNEVDPDSFYGEFSISPTYRFYFADNEAQGFFSQGFIKYKSLKIEDKSFYNLGVGIGAGFKKATSYNLVYGLDFGVGYNFINKVNQPLLYKGALFLGWRF